MDNFIGDNINALRVHLGLSQKQFADRIGTSQAAVSAWEVGETSPRRSTVARIADAFNVPFDSIMSEHGGFARDIINDGRRDGYCDVPLLGSIAAGKPIDMDAVDDAFPVPYELHDRYPNAFMLHVDGDSMNRRVPDGCLVMVNPDDRVPDGRSAYAVCVNGYSATIKRVRKLANGYELVPDSYDPTQRPIVFDYGVEGTQEVTVIGRVVWATMPFDYEI